MIQARIDHMAEIDQMIVKTAAVLGLNYPRKMLDALLDERITEIKINESLARLTENGYFECGSQPSDGSQQPQQVTTVALSKRLSKVEKTFVYTCHCLNSQGCAATCQQLRFQWATIQETAYEMYTENLRRQLHVKAAKFLELQAHKCQICGGGDFVIGQHTAQTVEKPEIKTPKRMPEGAVTKIRKMSLRPHSINPVSEQLVVKSVDSIEGK